MRLFVSGSAPLLAETHRAFEERTGHAILERYGMTETNMNTSNPYDGDRDRRHRRLPAAGRRRCASSIPRRAAGAARTARSA
jgi:malonyl-CoA/methylmalonyl-CoA synthetase